MNRFKSRQQIADEYGIHRTTFKRWIQRVNIKIPNGLISPKDQEAIYAYFGQPRLQHTNTR